MAETSRDTIQALYLAMLGYEADETALAWWENSDVRDVIAAISATDRYQERCAAVALGRATADDQRAQGAWRLHIGRGLSEIAPKPSGCAPNELLRVFPWTTFDEDSFGGRSLNVRVVGRYAASLAAELERRQPGVRAHPGIDGGPVSDVLVFSGHDDIHATLWAMPALVQATRRRLLAPCHVSRRREAVEADAVRVHLRDTLHDAGFMHVRQVLERRFGGGLALLHESFAGAVPGVVHDGPGARSATVALSHAVWFVADRAPIGGSA